MELTIWKYQLETVDVQKLQMPKNAEILTVQMQKDTLCLWALVNPYSEKEERIVEIFGTGHPIKSITNRKYISTYQLLKGDFVGHVFEKIR